MQGCEFEVLGLPPQGGDLADILEVDDFLSRSATSTRLWRGVTDNLLDIAAVAEKLGVGERHVRRLVFERRIPFIKWGHLIRFDPRDIDAWLLEARREALHPRAARRTSAGH
jgi:excisionase family DNA binding protein